MWRNFVSAAAVLLATALAVTGLLQAAGALPLPMALAGLAARLGFAATGYRHARARRFGPHRSFMARMVAAAAGAVLVRLLLAAVSWAGMDVHASYGVIAWAAWLLPLAAVEARLRREAATAGRARSDRGCNRRPGTLS